MKVTARNWRPEPLNSAMYRTVSQENEGGTEEKAAERPAYMNDWSDSSENNFKKTSEKPGDGVKMKSSAPGDSVGQLASMLARAETRIDVQQVSSKAMRALTSLKMSSVASEGKEKEKIARLIRRMEKLIKRINKKLHHLSKEEQLEAQRKQAEKKANQQKEAELRKELQRKRTKRRRDERNYASKEMTQDQKESSQELMDSQEGLGAFGGSTAFVEMGNAALDASAISSVSASVTEGVSVDISV